MVRSYMVTPRLWVGDIPQCGGVRADTVEGALQVIASGEAAVLPHGRWATARDVLRGLGVSDERSATRVAMAQGA